MFWSPKDHSYPFVFTNLIGIIVDLEQHGSELHKSTYMQGL